MSHRRVVGFRTTQSGRQFDRALLRAKCCGGRAEEAAKVTVEVGLITEAGVAAISASDKGGLR
jgi:hypothetical protein